MVKRVFIVFLFGMVLLALLPVGGMAKEKVHKRDPLLYGLASFLLPGLGQYLNEEPDKALLHFLIAVAIPVVCYYVDLPYPLYPVCELLSWGWRAYSDAYETAKRFNEEHGFAFHVGALPKSSFTMNFKEVPTTKGLTQDTACSLSEGKKEG